MHYPFNKSMNVWKIKVFLELKRLSAYQSESFNVFLPTFEQIRVVLLLSYLMNKLPSIRIYYLFFGPPKHYAGKRLEYHHERVASNKILKSQTI